MKVCKGRQFSLRHKKSRLLILDYYLTIQFTISTVNLEEKVVTIDVVSPAPKLWRDGLFLPPLKTLQFNYHCPKWEKLLNLSLALN